MSDSQAMTPAQKAIGDFAPKLVSLTDEVLFGDVWERTELSKRDRSLITVAALITNGSTEQLRGHLARAKDNGLSEAELKEVIIHLAFTPAGPGRCPPSPLRKRSSALDCRRPCNTRASDHPSHSAQVCAALRKSVRPAVRSSVA
jgi:4-carboxymuconolactone decarboxylase